MRIYVRQHASRLRSARVAWLVLAALVFTGGIVVLELWASPPGWLLPARRRTVATLQWIAAHWLNAAAVGVAAAIAGVLAPFAIHWLDRRRSEQPTNVTPQAQDRLRMVRRVRHKWIAGVLEPSLAHAARLALGLMHRPDALDLGMRARRGPGRPPQLLATGTPIHEVFDKVGGGLLILGAPGAGKTTLLLQLAVELLDRAERNLDQPIPVVVNLATWARRRQPLATWLVDELVVGYNLPERTARAWVKTDALALLLDGLDEVAEVDRAACAEAINAYRRDHGLAPLVVCSRTQELQALATRLRLEEAVELQPPSDTQIDLYLGYLELTGTPLGDMRAAPDHDEELRALLRSPLLLHVVALAYHGRPALALEAPGSRQQRQALLWEAYVSRMFEQRPLDPGCGYTSEQARSWLTWLAGRLRHHNQTEFYLDRLWYPWLPNQTQGRVVYHAVQLVVGLIAALASAPLARIAFGPVAGLVVALVFGLFLGVLKPPQWAEELRWSWRRAALGLPLGLAVGSAWGLIIALAQGRPWLDYAFRSALLFGFIGVPVRGLVGGMREERMLPNEGIRRSAQHALAIGLVSGLLLGLYAWLDQGLAAGLATGLGFGTVSALLFGGAMWLHYYAVRGGLARAGVAPWRYESFLEAMTERLLLRRGGNAYLFMHRLLADHLADFDRTSTAAGHSVQGR